MKNLRSKHEIFLAALAAAMLLVLPSESTGAQAGATSPAPAPATSAPVPLYQDFRGVRLGMTADETRERLGKPKDRDDAMDYYEFSDHQRARVYYGADKKVEAIVATYLGPESGAPAPEAIVGSSIAFAEDGSGSKKVDYPAEGYWVAYSRTAGDKPFVMVTIKKL
jgi:hypothetical protein